MACAQESGVQPRRTAGVLCCEGGHLTVPAIRISALLEPQRRASSGRRRVANAGGPLKHQENPA